MPGLKVIAPYDAADAKGLLKSAIRDPNPVVFLEHELLYGESFDVPDMDDFLIPIGKAKVRREGADVTIVTHSRMVGRSLEAAEILAADGIDAEVIDLRSLMPLDLEAIVTSVKKTGRAMILHEATRTSGFGAELIAEIQEHCFYYLEAPLIRVTGWDTPYPHAQEWSYFPTKDRVVKEITDLMSEQHL